jgi:hypothetical protein
MTTARPPVRNSNYIHPCNPCHPWQIESVSALGNLSRVIPWPPRWLYLTGERPSAPEGRPGIRAMRGGHD